MQLVVVTSSPSSSSSSQSAGGRPDHVKGTEEFQHLHLRSSPPPPPPPPPGPHCKAPAPMKKLHHRHGHHGGHSPPPRHHGHFAHKLRHDSFPWPPPPVCTLHCKKDKLRVNQPKHCKKVGKLHRKLMKACKPPKGTPHHLHIMHNVCPGARQLAPPFNPTNGPYHPGCCLHNRCLSMMQDEMLAELQQHPPPCQEAGVGHHGRHGHSHRHGRHGPRHVRSERRCSSAPPMSPSRHEADDMRAEPALEAGAPPPVSDNMLLAGEGGPPAVIWRV